MFVTNSGIWKQMFPILVFVRRLLFCTSCADSFDHFEDDNFCLAELLARLASFLLQLALAAYSTTEEKGLQVGQRFAYYNF